MKVVYIAGPYRGTAASEVAENIRRAERCACRVAEFGAMPLCPHASAAHFDWSLTDAFWRAAADLMLFCDAVMMVRGWQDSVGAMGERAVATARGLPVFESLTTLAAWLNRFDDR